jgi:DNA-binding transcriptional MerR regulator
MANMFSVSHRTLHFYEEKGLISADRIGLMRVYSHLDVGRMSVINACREVGIPVAMIQDLMTVLQGAETQSDADTAFYNALLMRKREMTAELSTLRRQLHQIGTLLPLPDETEAETVSNDNADPAALSELEHKCLTLMVAGYTPMRLARALALQGEELKQLEATIIRKFDAQTRFQAVAKAVLLGIVPA